MRNGGFVDVEKPKGLKIEEPHGLGIVMEQPLVLFHALGTRERKLQRARQLAEDGRRYKPAVHDR